MFKKQEKRHRRHKRVRAKIFGTAARPRLCVFKSGKHIYAQLINDDNGRTLVAASDLEIKGKSQKPKVKTTKRKIETEKEKKEVEKVGAKVVAAYEVGKLIAEKACKKKIEKIIFDRGGYAYHGKVKALAEGAREGGLKF